MALRKILTWPDPTLSRVCDPVGSDEDLSALIADMFDSSGTENPCWRSNVSVKAKKTTFP